MKEYIKGLFLAFGLMVVGIQMGSVVHAQRVSALPAQKFARLCTQKNSVTACDGYISGVADAVTLLSSRAFSGNNLPAPLFCVPVGTTVADMRRVVVAWMSVHRDQLGKKVGEVVLLALRSNYTCARGEPILQ